MRTYLYRRKYHVDVLADRSSYGANYMSLPMRQGVLSTSFPLFVLSQHSLSFFCRSALGGKQLHIQFPREPHTP